MDKTIGSGLKPKTEQLNKIRQTLKQDCDLNLTDKEALDCYIALFYLGRAIFRFNSQKGDKNGQP